MPTDSEDFFSGRASGIDTDRSAVETALRLLIKRFPFAPSFPELKRICKAKTGEDKVTLAWFYEENPSFPVRVAYRSVPWVRDMWSGLYSGFTKTELYKAWKEEADIESGDVSKPMALVFQWPKWKMCCMHNAYSGNFTDSFSGSSEGLRIHKVLKTGEAFVIEPFDQFLDSVTWSN